MGLAQEKPLSLTQKMKQEVIQIISKAKENEPDDWLVTLEDLSMKATNYIEEQQKECEGEYPVVEFDENNQPLTSTKILSASEKRLCQLDLLRFRKNYIEEIYSMRKKFVKSEYEKRLKNLDQQKAVLLEEINKISSQVK